MMPLMVDVEGKKVLVVGGGTIGFRKTEKLCDYGAKVTCVSESFCSDFEDLGAVTLVMATYDPGYLQDFIMIVAATDKPDVNRRIYEDSKNAGLLCMTVDHKSPSDYAFMATQKKGPLSISVSTDGGSPGFSKDLVEGLMASVTDEQIAELEEMIRLRRQKLDGDL